MSIRQTRRETYRGRRCQFAFQYTTDPDGNKYMTGNECFVDGERITLSTPGFKIKPGDFSEAGTTQAVRDYVDCLEDSKQA